MEMVGIVKVIHDGNTTNKEYAFKLPYWNMGLKKDTRVVIKDSRGVHTGICASDSFIVSENAVENVTEGNPLTGEVIGVLLDLYEHQHLLHLFETLKKIGMKRVPVGDPNLGSCNF